MRLAGWSARLLRRLGLDWVVFLCLNRYNYYLPHAPDCMYENEAMFYRHIRPELPAAVRRTIIADVWVAFFRECQQELRGQVVAPHCYGTRIDASSSTYLVAMENLVRSVSPTLRRDDSLSLSETL